MLKNIKLENFKSFKSLKDFDIKPITILCGANSCGKSSIMQSLLLFKQTKESRNPNQSILLNGKYVHLGDLKNIVYGKSIDNNLSLSYSFEFTLASLRKNRLGKDGISLFHLLSYIFSPEERKLENSKHVIEISIDLKASDSVLGYRNGAELKSFKVITSTVSKEGKVLEGASAIISSSGKKSRVKWNKIPTPWGVNTDLDSGDINDIEIHFENLFPVIIGKKNRSSDQIDIGALTQTAQNFFRAIDYFTVSVIGGISYLGPLREEPSRRYIYENEVVEIGVKGENAAYIYQVEEENQILGQYFFLDGKFYTEDKIRLGQALVRWLSLMKIDGFGSEDHGEMIRLNIDANSADNMKVNIADVGFGVSQIFPILLEGLRLKKQGTLLLEQPEIHLHPNLQMQLSDYFISLALSDKNVIVETHSDHIVNRLVRRIIEDNDHDLANKIAIYFVSSDPCGAKIEKVNIDPMRGVTNWPTGFFDQAAHEQEKIIMAGIQKRKLEKEKM